MPYHTGCMDNYILNQRRNAKKKEGRTTGKFGRKTGGATEEKTSARSKRVRESLSREHKQGPGIIP